MAWNDEDVANSRLLSGSGGVHLAKQISKVLNTSYISDMGSGEMPMCLGSSLVNTLDVNSLLTHMKWSHGFILGTEVG